MSDLRRRFDELRSAESARPADLDDLWADLDTVTVEEILGPWRGGDFATGHVISQVLTRSRWHGKRFESALDAKPLICRDEDGELFSDLRAGGMSPGIGPDDPILITLDDPTPGAYRILVDTDEATIEGRFWVTDRE